MWSTSRFGRVLVRAENRSSISFFGFQLIRIRHYLPGFVYFPLLKLRDDKGVGDEYMRQFSNIRIQYGEYSQNWANSQCNLRKLKGKEGLEVEGVSGR